MLSVSEWIEKTETIGLFVKLGKYGGTYAHKDIAFYNLKEMHICLHLTKKQGEGNVRYNYNINNI